MPPPGRDSGVGGSGRPPRILAAIVTYNRIELLRRSVGALRLQTLRPACVLIVDNSSTDGTQDWLGKQADLTVIRQANSGSAGGFNRAARHCVEEGFDWLWMMDDDTIPRPDALERLVSCPATSRPTTGFVYSLQIYPDGTVPTNDPGPTGPENWALTVLSDHCVQVERCSFVSVMVSRPVVIDVGYPMKEMFFMWDDYEFTRRIVDAGYKGFCVLDSIVLHDTKIPRDADTRGWSPMRRRFASRNGVYYVRTSSASWLRRTWRIARMFQIELFRVVRGASTPMAFAWLLQGLFFNPKAERPGGQP